MPLNNYNLIKNQLSKINIRDIISLTTIFVIFILLAKAAIGMDAPYEIGEQLQISLDTSYLPYYTLRTIIRMALALCISLIFSLLIGYFSAKKKRAEIIFIPLIDVLQSVPILGFLSISVIAFIKLFPNSLLGPECAAIFAIFTSQAWNMTLSIYQSIKLLPEDYKDIGNSLNLNAWQKFWRIELPYATPGLLWNMMISLSGGWFFVVASEAISVNNHEILLPGIGSYIQIAVNQSNISSILYAMLSMLIVIFAYDQIIFRPLLKISTQYQEIEENDNVDNSSNNSSLEYNSWIYDFLQKTSIIKESIIIKEYLADFWINKLAGYYNRLYNLINNKFKLNKKNQYNKFYKKNLLFKFLSPFKHLDWFIILITLLLIFILYSLFEFIKNHITIQEVFYVIYLGAITGMKIFALVIICSIIWVPFGVYIGSKPGLSKYIQPIIQFVAAFPANLFYPIFVLIIIKYNLNLELSTAPLLIIGTQWYILFNVIAGISNIPLDLRDVVKNLRVTKSLYWRKFLLPAIFPYYITGAMAAAGGAWNASIAAEALSWGDTRLAATGLGSYIVEATGSGDFVRIALGITVMSLYVTILNKLIWQKLYNLAANKYQII